LNRSIKGYRVTSKNHNLYAHYFASFGPHLDKLLLETDSKQVYTYRDADLESARLACFLIAQGLQPGDRVSAQLDKSPEALWLYLACLRAGVVFHPLNTAYQSAELGYFLANAEPSLVVCSSDRKELMTELASSDTQILTLNADGRGTLVNGAALVQEQDIADFVSVHREPDDLAALLYSSGTTGQPKGIMLTHENLASNASTLVEFWGFSAEDRLLHALPIFHVHGLFVALGCVFCSAASMTWLPKFDAAQTIEKLSECSVMMGVPTYYTRLLAQANFDHSVLGNMRLFISGSAPLLEETFSEFEARTGHTILERYGMSETSMNTSNPLLGVRKAGTVGLPLPGVLVRVVDGLGGVLPAGEIGNLQVKGPNVFKGYWRMPEKTAEDFSRDGFFNTGDKGRIDEEGYVSIVGRAKDMIICGGLNVYPKEIELFVDELSGVLESAVIGLPDADFGECVAAVLVPTGEKTLLAEDIIAELKPRMANFKVPKKVFVLDELPRNAMGKVQKNLLRKQFT